MDKPTENDIALNYDRGWRAYDIHYTTQKLFQNVTTGSTYWLLSDEDHTDWHALRTYQDEQRKKGVPIQYNEVGPRDSYTVKEKIGETKIDFFDFWPKSDYYGPQVWQTHHISNAIKYPVARFTNFRWRAGYPKPVRLYNDHGDNRDGVPCDGRCDSMACNCISPSDPGYPKGGKHAGV